MIVNQAFLKFTPSLGRLGLSAREFSIFGGMRVDILYLDAYPHWEALSRGQVLSKRQFNERLAAMVPDLAKFNGMTEAEFIKNKTYAQDLAADVEIVSPHVSSTIRPVAREDLIPLAHPAFSFSEKATRYLKERWFKSKNTGNRVALCGPETKGALYEKHAAQVFTYSPKLNPVDASLFFSGFQSLKKSGTITPPLMPYRAITDTHEAYHLIQLETLTMTDHQKFKGELAADLFAHSHCQSRKEAKALSRFDLQTRYFQAAFTSYDYCFAPALEALLEERVPPSESSIFAAALLLDKALTERRRQLWPYKKFKSMFHAFVADPRYVFCPLAGLVAEKAFAKESLTADVARKSLAAAVGFNPAWAEAPSRPARARRVVLERDALPSDMKLTI